MADYIFPSVNAGAEMVNPNISVNGVVDDFNGNCSVSILISISPAPEAQAAKFSIELDGFTYEGNWTQDEVSAWANIAVQQYEVPAE